MPRICPVCNARYDEGETFCARDGTELLEPGHDHSGSLVGTTIADRYEVLEQIATGGMGVVYKARQKMLDRYVALKVLPRELSNDPDTERRFFNEARAISHLRHPHIVTLFDFGRTDRKLFIAMEYINGEPLAVHIESRPLPVSSAVRIADQVLDALAEAHRAGIVHRDIKPDNVMLEVRGGRLHVRLLDFGIAKSDIDTARLTKTGIVFGTPEYISPEQVVGDPIDHRADLYAVGLILFEMLSGYRPFGGSGSAIAYKHAHDPVPSLLERYPEVEVPVALDALIYRLMAKDPDARPGSADEVRRLLLDATMGAIGGFGSGPLPPLDGALPPMDAELIGHESGTPSRLQPPTRANGPPPGPIDMPPPAEVVTGPPPLVAPPDLSSIDRVLGPRPPRPSVDHTPTLQAPAELFQRKPASRRPLVLGTLLALIGVGSLMANLWIERPFASQPVQTRAAEPAQSAPEPIPAGRPIYGPEVIAGLTGIMGHRAIPDTLKSLHDLAILPSPTIDGLDATDANTLRPLISKARQALNRMADDDPERLNLLARIGDLEWTAANAAYAAEKARYDQATAAFIDGTRTDEPAPPVPAYGNAVIAYQRLIEAAPSRETDRIIASLAHGLHAAGRESAARAHFARLVELHPDSPWRDRAHLMLGESAMADGDFTGARTHFAALIDSDDPHLVRHARFELGYVHAALGDNEAAVDALHALLESVRGDADAATYRTQALDALTLAYARLPGGRRQAIGYFRGLGGEALARRQSRLLAMAYAARGEPAEAAASWRAILGDLEGPIDGPGDRADILVQLAEQEAAAERVDASLKLLDGPLKRCAPLADSLAGLHCRVTRGNALTAADRHAEARDAFAPVADRAPIPDGDDNPYIAEARFRLVEPAFAAFIDDVALDADAVEAGVARLDASYRRVVEPGIERWQVAADYRRGLLYAHLADTLRGATVDGVDPALDARVTAARSRSMAHFAEAQRIAREAAIETRWARAAAARLEEMKPAP